MKKALPRFSSRVENYIKYRPGYPQAIIDLLRKECHLTTNALIADIGSGTGKLTELFLNNGYRVVGIEPDPEMRAAAEWLLQGYPRFTSIAATAEATSLADHSVDVVTAGQAFHWFEREQARREFLRILVPMGWVVLIWNIQRTAGTPFLAALKLFWQTYLTREGVHAEASGQDLSTLSHQTKAVDAWWLQPEQAEQELISPLFRSGDYRLKTFENHQVYDGEGLKGRVLSSYGAPEAGHPRFTEMLEALEALFRTHQVDGTITIEQETRLYYGRLSNT
jgi:ubiquinone/menaquinone biosynthesis C-methylase UbiE